AEARAPELAGIAVAACEQRVLQPEGHGGERQVHAQVIVRRLVEPEPERRVGVRLRAGARAAETAGDVAQPPAHAETDEAPGDDERADDAPAPEALSEGSEERAQRVDAPGHVPASQPLR